jgi:hypothetical protein
MKSDDNPMQSAHNAPRCSARAKTTGHACKSPAVKGWTVCRMHGAGGGAPSGKRNGMWKHGGRSRQIEEIRAISLAMSRWSAWIPTPD